MNGTTNTTGAVGGMFAPGAAAAAVSLPAAMGFAVPVVVDAAGLEVTIDLLYGPEQMANARQIIEGLLAQGYKVKGYPPRSQGGGYQGGGGGGGYQRGGGGQWRGGGRY